MHRDIRADIDFTPSSGRTCVALMVAAARVPGLAVTEEFTATYAGAPMQVREVEGSHDGRIHVLDLDIDDAEPGQVQVRYRAEVAGDGHPAAGRGPEPTTTELLTYLRPSRYAESDRLLPTARAEFAALHGLELLHEVANWVHERLSYVPGSSHFTDGSVRTMLDRRGVCRDYAHLVVALLRGLDVPARCAAVYAPGLAPMDFHAVAEAWVEGAWHMVDATRLAPRRAMVRIATGRDAADNAFMSTYGAGARLESVSVLATVDGDLPVEDHAEAVPLP